MNLLTNNNGISLAMAVWLAHEEYTDGSEDFPDESVISATSLLKPTKQLIMGGRVPLEERTVDVLDLFSARHGHALHNDIENAWTHGYADAMRRLGYRKKTIDAVRINPAPEEVMPGDFPVYLEQRHYRRITVGNHNIVVSGKFDQVINGELNDTKKTSVYAYINGTKEEDYRVQGSIYRWLNPHIVTSDTLQIQHIFSDWKASGVKQQKNYPPRPIMEFTVDLWSEAETESYIRRKIAEILHQQDLPEEEMTRCSDADLWRSDPVYKYYADPVKAQSGGRATKNFDDLSEANLHLSQKGKGVVITVPGKVKACGYCAGRLVCKQSQEYEHD